MQLTLALDWTVVLPQARIMPAFTMIDVHMFACTQKLVDAEQMSLCDQDSGSINIFCSACQNHASWARNAIGALAGPVWGPDSGIWSKMERERVNRYCARICNRSCFLFFVFVVCIPLGWPRHSDCVSRQCQPIPVDSTSVLGPHMAHHK